MEKKVFLFILVLALIFTIPLIFAAQEEIDNAYACLEDKIDEKTCDSLSVTEKIFSSLAVSRCSSELRAEAKDGECWPEASCDLKTTAQAVLALETSAAKDWLINQNGTPSEITWYLQIEPNSASTCNINYNSMNYDIEIGEDKKINSAAGNCLSLSSSGYWLEINPDCYEEEFEISCDEDFITNLLFKSDTSSTIHVSEKTSSATGGGTTTEKVSSFCFIDSGACDYEGSLWATLALDFMGEDVALYIPYLITMADANNEFFPEPFLYILTGYEDFRYDIFEKQDNNNGYWSISGDKYYDTALALYPFIGDTFNQKEEAKEWLLDQQESDGCWNSGNILDTAFVLHSVWPELSPTKREVECGDGIIEGDEECDGSDLNDETCENQGYVEGGDLDCYAAGTANECIFDTSGCIGERDCEEAGYSCTSTENCTGTEILGYVCTDAGDICCDEGDIWRDELGTCVEKNGIICTYSESCTGEKTTNVSDLRTGEECCLTGVCELGYDEFDCEDAGYHCMYETACIDAGGNVRDYTCLSLFDVCCNVLEIQETCAEAGGKICTGGEECTGTTLESADTYYCCFAECEEPGEPGGTEGYTCELSGGFCEYECEEGYVQSYDYDCEYYGDLCCMPENKPGPNALFYILIVLIILIVLGIVFRTKLKEFWFRIKSNFKKSPPPRRSSGSGFPHISLTPKRRIMSRRVMPAVHRPAPKPAPKRHLQDHSELDEVLKKLKAMGK